MVIVRYNNPGNIMKHTGTPFYGEIKSPHKRLTAFKSIEYGIRAMIKIIRTYRNNGYTTFKDIIYRYAPPVENNTKQYVNYVCSRCGAQPIDKVLSSDEKTLIAAICYYESHYILTTEMWNKAIQLL